MASNRKRPNPYLLSRKLAEHDVKILNAGSSGYGIDQMLFKGLRESHKDRPDLILFSFIPHGLIRIGKNFMYGRGKPKIIFDGNEVSVQPAVNAGLRHGIYADALSNASLLYWYLRYIYCPTPNTTLPVFIRGTTGRRTAIYLSKWGCCRMSNRWK